jgi:serine/threonine protein kinase
MMTEHQKLVEGNEHSRRIGNCKSDFEVLEKLGRGAHGVVFKVKSRKNGQTYVMKIVDFSSKGDGEGQFRTNAIREV